MLRFMRKAVELESRVLLVGDTSQLSSVERGNPLRLLEDDGLVPVELKEIVRQKNKTYLAVVQEMTAGKVVDGLNKAHESKFVVELDIDLDADDDVDETHESKADRIAAQEAAGLVAETYRNKQSNIVVAPTHALGRVVTTAIRRELQAQGLLGEDVASMTLLRQVDYCEADRQDALHALQEGDIAVMRRDDERRGLQMGQVLHAQANDIGKVHLFRETGVSKRVPPGLDPRAFSVYRSESISVAVGDKVCALEPIKGMERGDRATVKSIDHWARTLKLDDGREVSMDSKHLGYGYVTTVPGAQGLSVDNAIVVVTTSSLPALSQEGLYVAASRGRHNLCIITDDLDAVREAVARSGGVTHGIDVAEEAQLRERLERGEPADLEDLLQDVLDAGAPGIGPSMNAPGENEPAGDVADGEGPHRTPALVEAIGAINLDSELERPPADAVDPRSSQFAGIWPVPADLFGNQADILEASARASNAPMKASGEDRPARDVVDEQPSREPAFVGAVEASTPDLDLERLQAQSDAARSNQFAGVWSVPADVPGTQPVVAARTPGEELDDDALDVDPLDFESVRPVADLDCEPVMPVHDLDRLDGDRTEPVVPTQVLEELDVALGESAMPTWRFEELDVGANDSAEVPGPHASAEILGSQVADRRERAVRTGVVVPRRVEPYFHDADMTAVPPVVEDLSAEVDVAELGSRTWRDVEATTMAAASSDDIEPAVTSSSVIVDARDAARMVGDEAALLSIEDHSRSDPAADVSHPEESEPRGTTEPAEHKLEFGINVVEEIEELDISEPEFELEM